LNDGEKDLAFGEVIVKWETPTQVRHKKKGKRGKLANTYII
jgi:hypothetical protein